MIAIKHPFATEEKVDVGHGITFEWLDNGTVVVVASNGYSRDIVDCWAEKILEMIDQWPKDLPLSFVSDVRLGDISRYSTHKATQLMSHAQDIGLKGCVVTVVNNSLSGQLIRMLVNNTLARLASNIENRVFTDFDQAVAYVRQRKA